MSQFGDHFTERLSAKTELNFQNKKEKVNTYLSPPSLSVVCTDTYNT